jgi:hypothetical protein
MTTFLSSAPFVGIMAEENILDSSLRDVFSVLGLDTVKCARVVRGLRRWLTRW